MLRIGVVTDTHVAPAGTAAASFHNDYDFDGTVERLERALALFAQESVDLVLHLGDVTHNGDVESQERAAASLDAWPGQLWVVPGNHDFTVRGGEPGCGNLAEYVSLAPGLGLAGLEVELPPESHCRTTAPPAISDWGEDVVLLANHYPVISRADAVAAADLPYAGDLADQPDVLAAVRARTAPTIVLNGHLHLRDTTAIGSLLQLSFASVIEPPHECSVVEIDAHADVLTVSRRAIALAESDVPRLPALVEPSEEWYRAAGRWRPSS